MASLTNAIKARLDPTYRYGLRVTLFALALILIVGPFGLLLRDVTQQGALTEVDTAAANTLHEEVRESPMLVTVLKVVTFLGSPAWFYVLLGGFVIYLALHGRSRVAAYVAVTSVLGGLISRAVKVWVARPRPSLVDPVASASGMSFPSGHAMGATVCYGVLLLAVLPMLPRKWRAAACVAYALTVASISFTRLALGVHYITDVVGGIVLGLAWVAIATAAFGIWRAEEATNAPGTDEQYSNDG